MNIRLFYKLMEDPPAQQPTEWRMFLEICELYLKRNEIQNPIVVEVGILHNKQKPFYEQLLGAYHIGIDFTDKRGTPDILGDSLETKTMETLKEMLEGKPIDILFIDASHYLDDVTSDFNMYSPLCDGIVALHDIETGMFSQRAKHSVYKFWDELKNTAYTEVGKYEHHLFLSICQRRWRRKRSPALGIGVIVKK